MKILFVETFFKGSHKSWANELREHLDEIDFYFLTDSTSTWKEAMTIAVEKLDPLETNQFDLVLLTSMVDLKKFKDRYKIDAPHILYFHENQRSYPWTKNGKNNRSDFFSQIQIQSAKVANFLLFNSHYNLKTFCLDDISLKTKSDILAIGLETDLLKDSKIDKNKELTILWNHRWEYDKNPDAFFSILKELRKEVSFKLIITGESPAHVQNRVFTDAKEEFKDEIIHFGFAKSKADYYKLLWQSHLSIVTSNHDFFGISVCESILCDVHTILPNRLAYPEHFTSHDNFYNNESELILKIRDYLEKKIINKTHKVNTYDWNNIKKQYYKVFKSLESLNSKL